jgi:hypothetical protein
MTTLPPDDHDPSTFPETPVDEERLAALRALLRDEPIDIDAAATETRIMAALDAADAAPAATAGTEPGGQRPADHIGGDRRTTTPPPPARWRVPARPLLVAAGVLAVLGVGAAVWSASDQDAEYMASAGDAATAETTTRPPGDDADGVTSDLGGGDGTADSTAESAGPASTLAPPPPPAAASADGTLADLGRFDSVDDLLRRVAVRQDTSSGAGGADGFARASTEALECAATRSAAGETVLGTAAIGATTVLVVEADGTPLLFELPSCRARA